MEDKDVLQGLVRMLRQSETMDKYSLVNLLEELLERAKNLGDDQAYGELERTLVDLLEHRFYVLEPEPGAEDDEHAGHDLEIAGTPVKAAANAIEVFELALVLSKDNLRSASLKASALEFLILTSINPTGFIADKMHSSTKAETDLRIAAVSCLAEVYSRIVEGELIPSDVPTLGLGPDDKLQLRGRTIIPLLDIIGDGDELVSDKAVEILYGRINDEDRSVEQFFWAHEGSVERLVHKLALSRGNSGGEEPAGPKQHSLTEWLLSVLIQRGGLRVAKLFSSFWADGGVERSVKQKLVSVLPTTLSNIQETARRAGISLDMDSAQV